jgi:hypothetical protein
VADIDQEFEDRLREAYVGFGPMMVSSIARQEHTKVLERDEFLKEFIEWAAYMGFDGHGFRLRIKALTLLGLEDEVKELVGREDDGEGV